MIKAAASTVIRGALGGCMASLATDWLEEITEGDGVRMDLYPGA